MGGQCEEEGRLGHDMCGEGVGCGVEALPSLALTLINTGHTFCVSPAADAFPTFITPCQPPCRALYCRTLKSWASDLGVTGGWE